MQVIGVVLNFIFSTFMRTSCSFGGATSTSSMLNGLLASHSTAALHLITWKQQRKWEWHLHFQVTTQTDSSVSACEAPAHICGEERENYREKTPNETTKKSTPKVSVSLFFSPTKIMSDFADISVASSFQLHV